MRHRTPVGECRWFREHRWPLEHEQVWIGRYDGMGDGPVTYHHYAPSVMLGDPFAGALRPIWPTSGATVGWPPPTLISGDRDLHGLIAVFDDSWQAQHRPPD